MGKQNRTLVVYHTEQRDITYVLEDETLQSTTTEDLSGKSTYAVGVLGEKELINYSFDIEKGLPINEMEDAVEIRMFQDAGLNHMIDYKIVHGRRDSLLDVKNASITAFAAVPNHFNALFEKFRGRHAHLDSILPFSTLPLALYNADILEKKCDIFLYIREKESTLGFFYDGTFVYSKNFGNGLKGLYELFVKNNNEGVSYDTFVKNLLEKGVDSTSYEGATESDVHLLDLRQLLEKLLSDATTVIGYAKRMAGLEGFDRLFIGSQRGTIPALASLVQDNTGISGYDFDFYTAYYPKGTPYVDQNIILSLIEGDNALAGRETNPFNLTLYPRPPRFIRRDAGRFLTLSAASLIAALLYPAFLYFNTTWQSYTYRSTLEKLQISQGEFLELKAKEDALKADKEHYQLLLEDEKKSLQEFVDLLKEIDAKKTASHSRSEVLGMLFNRLNAHTIQIASLQVSDHRYTLRLQAKEDDDLTAFLRTIAKEAIFTVDMHGFSFDPANKRYTTTIIVAVKA